MDSLYMIFFGISIVFLYFLKYRCKIIHILFVQ